MSNKTAKAIIQHNKHSLTKAEQVHVLNWTLQHHKNGTVYCNTMTTTKRYTTFIKGNGQAYCSCPAFAKKKDVKPCKHLIALALVIENKKNPTGF